MEFIKMKSDEEFIELLPFLAQFSLDTSTPLWKNVKEVASSFSSNGNVTWLFKDVRGRIEGYLHGVYLSNHEFHISQCWHRKGEGNEEAFSKVCSEVKKDGIKKVIILTTLNPKIFEKYGLQLERFLLSKEI